MIPFLLWYFVTSLLSLITFPLAFHLLPALPDRGYVISRVLGLLLWGYLYWLLGSLGILRNELGGLLFAFGVILILSAWVLNRVGLDEIQSWWKSQRPLVIVAEVLFLVTFAGWVVVRAANPDIYATEKPHELAFVNAIIRSPTFPPNDPWLSGYAISYYYFGYVMTAMLSMVTSVPAGIAFNLAVALIFALSALGAFGVVYNMLAVSRHRGTGTQRSREASHDPVIRQIDNPENPKSPITHSLFALLGPLFVLVLSNLEGFLELLHARGLFWRPSPDGGLMSGFWMWLGIENLMDPPSQPFSWMPTRFLWWWRASRVVEDLNFNGDFIEVIDEFPFFSFLLADLHPHVLAIPFALLAVTLALNVCLGGAAGKIRVMETTLHLSVPAFAVGTLALGGLAFLNTWDFPIHVALFTGAYVLYRVREVGWGVDRLKEFIGLGLALGVGGVVLYLPFYVGFSSQAGGILPNLINPTRGAHLWLMFGGLLLPLMAYLIYLWRTEGAGGNLKRGLSLAFGVTIGLWVFSLLLVVVISLIPGARDVFVNLLGAPDSASLIREAFSRRFTSAAGWLSLTLLLALTLALLLRHTSHFPPSLTLSVPHSLTLSFPLLLTLTATLLVLTPEFVYLRDQFGTRMNTVFKFYYQSWLLWGLTAAYGAAVLLQGLRGVWRGVYAIGLAVVLGMGLVYPALSLVTKTNAFHPVNGWTLDGTKQGHYLSVDDVAAVNWLQTAPLGTLVEAVGGSYSGYGRISAHSGLPTLLGWPGHESQWRGGAAEMGSRHADVEQLYRTPNWEEAMQLLQQYNIRYIYVGQLERRSSAGVNETKFRRNLELAFEQGQVTIYEVPAGGESAGGE